MPLTAICNARLHRPAPAPAVQEHHLCRRARRRCSTSTSTVIEKLIGEQFKGKDKLIAPNIAGAASGPRLRARRTCECPIGLQRAARRRGRRPHLHRGQHRRRARRASMAARRSAPGIRSRRRPRSPRPSPSTASSCRVDPETGKNRYAIVQAEDELASIGMVIGAAWNGARAFTATSGPGISLMQEFIGLAYFAEIPAVIFDVQRGGPSTGMPTRTQQSDILSCAYASHGDTKHVLLFPEDPRECFEFARRRFDLADRLQTPIFVMLDLDIGMNEWLCEPLAWDDSAQLRPRQGDDRRGARGRQGLRPLSRRRRRRHPLPHLSRHASDQGRVLHARHLARPLRALHRGGRRPTSTTCSGCCASSRPRRRWCRSPVRARRAQPTALRRDLFRLDRAGDGRGARHARGAAASTSTRCACAPSRSPTRSIEFIADHDHVFVVEQNRDAQLRTLLVNECEHRSGAARCRSCTTTARRSPRASSSSAIAEQSRRARR